MAAGLVSLTLGVASAIIVPKISAAARGQVSSYQDARSISCQDQKPGVYPEFTEDNDPAEVYVPSIDLTSSMNCELRFFVSNHSTLPIDLTGVSLPMSGPFNSNGGLAVDFDGEAFNSSPGDVDAEMHLDRPHRLEAGETATFSVHLKLNTANVCMEGEDAAVIYPRAPDIFVSAWGFESLEEGLSGGYALTGTKDSGAGCG